MRVTDSTRSVLPPISKEGLIARSSYPFHSFYTVKQKIGQGTWGGVWIAADRLSGLERAVKQIPKRFTNELARFRQEIVFLQSLDHPNVIRLYEIFEDYLNIYLVMEYCKGGELFDSVISSSSCSEATSARIMYQIILCLCYIHAKNIAHRDLKPENFMFASSDITSSLKLIDFGLAKRFNNNRKMKTRVGSLCYIAPEVIRGTYDEKCDVWSAGVILYFLLSGTLPFTGPTDACIAQQISDAEAKDLVKLLLERDVRKKISANVAIKHPWFKIFLPSPLKITCRIPKHLSVPEKLIAIKHETHTLTCSVDPNSQIDFPSLDSHQDISENVSCSMISTSPLSRTSSSICSGDDYVPPVDSASTTHLELFNACAPSIEKKFKEWALISKRLVPKWRRFAMHNQLKRAALRVIAQQLEDEHESVLPLRTLFLALDSENDGTLSSDEIVSGVSQLLSPKNYSNNHILENMNESYVRDDQNLNEYSNSEILSNSFPCTQNKDLYDMSSDDLAEELGQLVNGVSLDGGTNLEYSNFLAASIEPHHYMRESVLKAAFRVFDRDGDGHIKPSEVKASLGWSNLYSIPKFKNTLSGRDDEVVEQKSAIDKEIETILISWDKDGDGAIGFEDFVSSLRTDEGKTSFRYI